MIFRILIFVSLNFGANYLDSNTASNYLGLNIPDTLRFVGIMVDFPIESPDNPAQLRLWSGSVVEGNTVGPVRNEQ